MKVKSLFFNDNSKLRTIWRVLIFSFALSLAISPLVLIENSHLQFLGATVILIFGLYLNSKHLDKIDFSEYGLIFKRQSFVYLIIGVLIGTISVASMFFIGKTSGILLISEVKTDSNNGLILLFGLKMLLVGILEETFFRGYLFTNIYKDVKSDRVTNRQGFLIALLVSSLLFGFAHISTNNVSILSITFLSINGIVWCIPFAITKNLGLSIGLHAAWNFTQTQLGFTMSGNKTTNPLYNIENNASTLLTGGEYGPEAGVLGLIGFTLMLMLSLGYLKLTRKIKRYNTIFD